MVGDHEVIQNLIKENHDLEGKIEELGRLISVWKSLYYESRDLIEEYKILLHSKEH